MSDSSLPIVALVVWLVVCLGVYVWTAASLQAVFRKAGEEGWMAWVPVLNVIVLLRLGGFSGWFVLLGFVPIVNVALFVILIISYHRINLAFGYGAGMTVLAALVLPVWSSILGWGSARWVGAPAAGPAAGPMRRGDGASPQPDTGHRPDRAYDPSAGSAAAGPAQPFPYSQPAGYTPSASVASVPPRPPLPASPSVATAPQADAPRPVLPPVWAPSDADVRDAPAPRRSSAGVVDEQVPPRVPAVAPPPAYAPTVVTSARPAPTPAPVPPAESHSSDGDAAPLDWWAAPPSAAIEEMSESAAPRRSDVEDVDPLDEDTRDVAGMGRGAAAASEDDDEDDDLWAPPTITPPPPAYSDGPLRSRRSAPPQDDLADEPFDTSFEVSAVAGAPTLGAPVSALDSVSAVQPGTALPEDAALYIDDDGFDETVVAVRRRATWSLRPPLGAPIAVTSDVLILGRRPAGDPEFPHAQLVPISDETRTMSKVHARLELHGDEWMIVDLDSTNGVVLVGPDGGESEITSGIPERLGTHFLLGDAELHLDKD